MRIAASIVMIAFFGATPVRAYVKAAAQVKAAKGPVQITLRLHKTTVKTRRSLWYKLELKNVGKKKFLVHDRFYKDPWAIYKSCDLRNGIYLEIIDPKGKPMTVKPGNYHERRDWEPEPGGTYWYSPEERKEIDALEDGWKKSGMTAQQQSIAWSAWSSDLHDRKNRAEDGDPAKQLWLKPGASTTTFAWVYRNPVEEADHSNEEAQVEDYTQLWSYDFFYPGKYRIRAVYDYEQSESTKKLFKKHGHAPDPLWMEFKTPFVEFEVLP